VKLLLPYPVSANRYWRSFAYLDRTTKKPRSVTVPSDEAKAFKQEVGWRAKAAGFKEPTTKPIEIASITLCPRTKKDGTASATVLDLGNCWKVVEDALQGIVYVNDRQIKRIANVEYGAPSDDGALIIEVIEFTPAPAPMFSAEIDVVFYRGSQPVYTVPRGARLTLFEGAVVVAHRDGMPVRITEGGRVEELSPGGVPA
jgi:crossover junction endodeoxyribonuclease RusA